MPTENSPAINAAICQTHKLHMKKTLLIFYSNNKQQPCPLRGLPSAAKAFRNGLVWNAVLSLIVKIFYQKYSYLRDNFKTRELKCSAVALRLPSWTGLSLYWWTVWRRVWWAILHSLETSPGGLFVYYAGVWDLNNYWAPKQQRSSTQSLPSGSIAS